MSFNFYKQMKTVILLLVGLFLSSGLYAQLTGTKTIDPAGSGANNYFSVAQAVLDLNAVGVGTGGVTFNVAAGVTFTETADIVLTTTTSDATKPIIFQRSGSGTNPLIRAKVGTVATTTYGNNGDAVIKVVGTDYVTFDGLTFSGQSGASSNTTRTEYGIMLTKTATDACKNITVKNCTFSLDKANAYSIGIYQSNLGSTGTAITVTSEGGRSENNLYVGNTFSNTYHAIYANGFVHTTAPFNFLDNNNIILNNLVENFGGSSVACYGIYTNNQDSAIVRGNTINGGTGNTTTLYGIYNNGGTNTTLTFNSNTITLNSTGTSTYYALYILGTASGTSSVVTVDSNTLQNMAFSSTSSLYGIYPAGAPKTLYVRHNKYVNNTINGSIWAFYVGASNSITNAIVHNNVVEGSRRSSATGSGSHNGFYMTGYSKLTFYNNRVRDIFFKAGHTGSLYGYYDFSSGAGSSLDFYDNTIDSLYTNGTGVVWGAYFSNGSSTNRNIYNNKFTRFYTQGGGTLYGVYLASGDTTNFYRNELSRYKMDSARSVTLAGIYLLSGTGYRVYNNMLHDYTVLNSWSSSTTASAVRGMWINSTDASVYNNSLYITGTSTTTNANGFGADGIFVGTTPTNLDLRNNIIINKVVPVAPNKSVALRRSSTTVSGLNSLMNNNIYYTVATPTNTTPYYWDGTNVDTTIDQLKSRLAPAESNSLSEDVPFLNTLNAPYDLHINPSTPTRVEGGASSEPFVTVDYDGNTRNVNTPDIGADEGTFTAVAGDFAGPTIANVSITPNTFQCNALPHVITATITDASGVASSRILWTKNGVSQTPINMTRGASNVWTGTIPAQYSTNSSIQVSWNLLANDSATIPNSKSYLGTTYKDASLFIDAGYTGSDSVNAGTFVQFNAKPTPTNVTTGTNNSLNNINTTPFYRGWGGNKRQHIYRASELLSAGLPAGGITALTFDVVTTTGAITAQPGFTLYIDSTNVGTATTTYLTPSNTVFGPANYTPTYGANTFNLTNPFVWNGTSNIYVTICWSDQTAGGLTTTYYVKSSTTTYASSTTNNIDNQTPAAVCATTTGSTQLTRPDILFSYNPPRTIAWTSTGGATLSATNILNPSTTLTNPGTYQFIVSINDGTCTNTDTVNIVTLVPQKPVANFSASTTTPNIGGSPTSVTFTDQSSNVPDKWKWEFTPNNVIYMSGTNDSSQNPIVQFTARGPFTVKLTARNLGGSDDTVRTNYISTVISYCASNATSTADDDIGNVSIFDFATQATLLSNGVDSPWLTQGTRSNQLYTNWHDTASVAVPTMYKGDKYNLRLGRIWSGSAYSTHATAFIDYNNNGSFADPGETIDLAQLNTPLSTTNPNPNRTTTTFTIPCTSDTGYLRMRIVLIETVTTVPNSSCGTYTWGETEDYKIRILPTQLVYDSSASYHAILTDVQPNTTNNNILGVKVVARGCDGNLAATNFNMSMTGTTNLADVTNVKLWYTGSSNVFATTTQYDVNKTASATLSFTGNQALLADTNYFWLTYDLATNATLGNSIDAVVNSVTVGGVAQVPAVTSPIGSRLINFPVTVVSNTLTQTTGTVGRNTDNNTILTNRLIMSSLGAAVPLTEVKVALTGTTRKADIKNVKVWFTGSNNALNTSTAIQFDSTKTILSDTMTFTGNQAIGVDTNYLWLTYSIKDTALIGNFADGEILSVKINNSNSSATSTNPAGNRRIINPYCTAAATSTADEDIGQFKLGSFVNGVDTPIASNPLSNRLYTDFTNLPGLTAQKRVASPISVSIINSSAFLYGTSVNVFIDYNQNGTFDLPQERVFKAISANNIASRTVSGTLTVPITALTGPTRMRIIANETTTIDLNPCGTFTWGEVEDYTIDIQNPPPGDYYPPDFGKLTFTPSTGQCVAVPHVVKVKVTDTTAVSSVVLDYTITGAAQTPIAMTRVGTTDTFSVSIPAAGSGIISFKVTATDVSPNINVSVLDSPQIYKYQDEYFDVSAGADKFIGVGQTATLNANTSLDKLFKITEFNFFNYTGGCNTNGSQCTWPPYLNTADYDDNIEFTNLSTASANLSGYTFQAAGISSVSYTFPPGTIVPPRGTVILHTTTGGTDDPINHVYHISTGGFFPGSGTSMGMILKDASGVIVDAVATNGYTFTTATGVTGADWSGAGVVSPSGIAGATLQGPDANNNSNWVTASAATPVSIGFINPNLPIISSTATVTWTGGLLTAPVSGSTLTTPTHPTLGSFAYYASANDGTCTSVDTVLVNVVPPPTVTLGADRVLCTGSTITLDAGNAGSTFSWSTGAATQTIDITVGATYTVAVTNQAGLIGRDTIVITQVVAPTASLGADTVYVCAGSTTALNAGNAGATYLWSNGATTQSVNVGSAGVYTVAVTNTAGCTTIDSVRILNYTAPTVNIGPDVQICAGTPVVCDAGNPGAQYLWSNGATTQTITVTQIGTYSVAVTNIDGCVGRDTMIITSKPLPVVSLGADKAKCPTDSVTLDAGAGFASYLWNTGATTQTVRTATAGVYVVIVTNADGCAARDTIVVTNNALPVVNLGNDRDICTSDTVTLDAGNAGSTYLWSNGATTQTIKVNLAGTYSVIVTNSFGCVSSDAVAFTNKPVPISTFSVDGSNGQSVVFLATATAGLQFAWNFGDPTSAANTSQLANPTHVFTTPGTYTVTLTVTNVATGCRATTTETVIVTGLGNDFAEIFKLGAAPNPFAGQTLISYVLPENANDVTVEVYDMIGRRVANVLTGETQSAGAYTFDYKNEDLQTASGVYMVRLTVDGKVAYIRIVDIAKK